MLVKITIYRNLALAATKARCAETLNEKTWKSVYKSDLYNLHLKVYLLREVKLMSSVWPLIIMTSYLCVPQLDLHMEESVDEVNVSWEVSHLETGELQVTPTVTQVTLGWWWKRCICCLYQAMSICQQIISKTLFGL